MGSDCTILAIIKIGATFVTSLRSVLACVKVCMFLTFDVVKSVTAIIACQGFGINISKIPHVPKPRIQTKFN